MAAPASIMLALDGLKSVECIDIRPSGKYDGLTHYSVRCPRKGQERVQIFRAVVDMENGEIGIKNPWEQTIFTCYGGLNSEKDEMSVYPALNFFRGPIMTVCGLQLKDTMEKDNRLQLQMFYNARANAFRIIQNKHFGAKTFPSVHIRLLKEISTVLMHFNFDSFEELSPLKTALTLMAALKVIHYKFLLHRHLMPSDIPHLMPPGTPKEPLSVLESVGEMLMRPSVSIAGTKTIYNDLLDAKTLKTVLVVEYDQPNAEQSDMKIFIRDLFGVIQIQAQYDMRTGRMEIYNCKNKRFGQIDESPRKYKVFDKSVMYLHSTEPHDRKHRSDSKVYQVKKTDQQDYVVACYYLMPEWRVVHISLNSKVPVYWKAVILAHSTAIAMFFLKVWGDTAAPFVPKYLFRETLK